MKESVRGVLITSAQNEYESRMRAKETVKHDINSLVPPLPDIFSRATLHSLVSPKEENFRHLFTFLDEHKLCGEHYLRDLIVNSLSGLDLVLARGGGKDLHNPFTIEDLRGLTAGDLYDNQSLDENEKMVLEKLFAENI